MLCSAKYNTENCVAHIFQAQERVPVKCCANLDSPLPGEIETAATNLYPSHQTQEQGRPKYREITLYSVGRLCGVLHKHN